MRAEVAGTTRTVELSPVEVPGRDPELAPEAIWRAVLGATEAALLPETAIAEIEIGAAPDLTLVWDRDTLGAPHPALAGPDSRAEQARWLSGTKPHLWTLVLDGSYVLGGAESYVVARMTRGTYEVTDVAHAVATGLYDTTAQGWSAAACARVGLPVEALPEVVATGAQAAVSEAGSFAGLALPVRFGPPLPVAPIS